MYELYIVDEHINAYNSVDTYDNEYDMFTHIISDPEHKYAYVYNKRVHIISQREINRFIKKKQEYDREVRTEELSFFVSTYHKIPGIIARDMAKIGRPRITQEHMDSIEFHKVEAYRNEARHHMNDFKEKLKKNLFKEYL